MYKLTKKQVEELSNIDNKFSSALVDAIFNDAPVNEVKELLSQLKADLESEYQRWVCKYVYNSNAKLIADIERA